MPLSDQIPVVKANLFQLQQSFLTNLTISFKVILILLSSENENVQLVLITDCELYNIMM